MRAERLTPLSALSKKSQEAIKIERIAVVAKLGVYLSRGS